MTNCDATHEAVLADESQTAETDNPPSSCRVKWWRKSISTRINQPNLLTTDRRDLIKNGCIKSASIAHRLPKHFSLETDRCSAESTFLKSVAYFVLLCIATTQETTADDRQSAQLGSWVTPKLVREYRLHACSRSFKVKIGNKK